MADPAELLDVATEAARAAGRLLLGLAGAEARGVRSKTTPTDLVSDADLAAERAIADVLARRRPGDGVLAEEGGGSDGTSGVRWVVDPLDGTINFLFGIPHWCVSIACEDGAGLLAGVVHDPSRDETFTACRGAGAWLRERRLEGPEAREAAHALVATGFNYSARVREVQAGIATRLLPEVRDLRRMGSAALDLAWVAAGRYDAFAEHGLSRWDRAAGELLCREAGLDVVDLPADAVLPPGVLVAPPALRERLLELVRG